MPFYFNTILINSFENYSIVIVDLGLSLELIIFPCAEDFVTVSVCFW